MITCNDKIARDRSYHRAHAAEQALGKFWMDCEFKTVVNNSWDAEFLEILRAEVRETFAALNAHDEGHYNEAGMVEWFSETGWQVQLMHDAPGSGRR